MLDHDVDLRPSNLSGLTGPAEVRAFFARLGYPTESWRETFPDSEGMRENLASAVRRMELVARDELGLLDIYLLEVSSVTVARIQELASHFRQRGGYVMAVLTSDYERLDFVLFDFQTREGKTRADAALRVLPRRISLGRLHESDNRAKLRALRRFSWTEPDALAQWDKLRSAFSIGEWSEEFFDNRGLFADYFLKERLREQPEWDDPALKDARRELTSALLEARGRFHDADEQALREGLLEPVLTKLGFQLRPGKDACDSDTRCPDYDLLDPSTGRRLAVCLAYQWDRFLDGPDPDDKHTGVENPGAAVLTLLDQEDTPWAIVTNGKQWRLYTSKTESRATNFYQVDAEEAAADTDIHAFRYFWLLFRAQAFAPHTVVAEGETRELNFLEQLLNDSREYAKQVGERLKKRVFNDIFPILAEGFIEDLRAREGEDAELDDDRLRLVFNATLLLLYRLLFLLYAESRDLLPVREVGGYYEKSLSAMKKGIADTASTVESARDGLLAAAYSDTPVPLRQESDSTLYGRLADLFTMIANGRASTNVPPYNGGLFLMDGEHALDEYERVVSDFLSEHSLSDRHLAGALDRLARDPDDKTHGLVPIDFKSLGVRQLGSIYEGLLEFKLRIAPTLMAVCDRKGTEVILPYDEAVADDKVKIKRQGRGRNAEEVTIPAGTVYLENSKHERKATGSYYTPDYIVRYIVENTVGPVLEEKLEALRPDLDQVCRDAHKREKDFRKHGLEPSAPLQPAEQDLVERLFDLKVLDPAMGSGHFLVTAVDFVADRLLHFLNGFPGNPVQRLLSQTRQQILKELPEGVIVDESRLTDVNLLKRHVLKRCVYGVDLNRMAVELAKVSLWLHCFTLGAPLSFLDHHLKWGNSLIGEVSTAEVSEADGTQAPLGGLSRWDQFSRAVRDYLMVSQLSDASAGQVLASRAAFREAEDILRPHREELNILTARHFAGWKDKEVGQAQAAATPEGQELFRQAQALAAEHRFFHWPLEFPEVWYGVRAGTERVVARKAEGEAGFDAVVGNPPYVRVQGLQDGGTDLKYMKARYQSMQRGSADIYVAFVERALPLLRSAAGTGFIVPHKFFTADYGAGLRERIARAECLRSVVHFGDQQVFEGVTTYTCLLFLSGSALDGCVFHQANDLSAWEVAGTASQGIVPTNLIGTASWTFNVDASARLVQRLQRMPMRIGDIAARIAQGIRTSADDVYIVDILHVQGDACDVHSRSLNRTVALESQLVVPFVRGRDIKAYHLSDGGRGVIIPYRVANGKPSLISEDDMRACFPLTMCYLDENRPRLESREDDRMCGPGWYGFVYPKNIELMGQPKLLVPDVADRASFAADKSGSYAFVSGYALALADCVPESSDFVLALLNSKLLTFLIRRIGTPLQNGFFRYFTQYIEALPFRSPDLTHPGETARTERGVLSRAISALAAGDYATPLALASQALATHAALHGPAGKPELREDPYWRAVIAGADTSFPGREDFVHDLLASLAQRMMDLNRDQHAETDRFVTWLKQELRVDVEDLTRKTHIKGYPDADFARLQEALQANRRKLALPVDGLFGAQLRDEYDKSMALLRPLQEALANTDRLIDQIVYRLYGLTEEEIAVVEGNA